MHLIFCKQIFSFNTSLLELAKCALDNNQIKLISATDSHRFKLNMLESVAEIKLICGMNLEKKTATVVGVSALFECVDAASWLQFNIQE